MTIELLEPQARTARQVEALTALWAASVRATHDFLTQAEVQDQVRRLPQLLRQVSYLAVAVTETGTPAGFLGASGHTLEVLALAPEYLGTGLGDRLFRQGMGACYLAQIPVYEENRRALAFFLRRSYKVHHRDLTDRQGRPHPLLTLTLSCY